VECLVTDCAKVPERIRDERDIGKHRKPMFREQAFDRFHLIGLNIKKGGIRLASFVLGKEAARQNLIRAVKSQHQENAQAEGKQQKERPILRAVEIGHALPKREGPARRNQAAHAPPQ